MTTARSFSSSALALLLLCCRPAHAHPRDELEQVAYVGITPTAVTIELNLTPGDLLARTFATRAEKPDYPQRVLSDLSLWLDGAALPLYLSQSHVPESESLRRGEQSVRLVLKAPLASLSGGRHTLTFRNRHAPAAMTSGYLAAMLQGTEGIQVGQQTHDATQQTLTVAFEAPATGLPLRLGMIGALLALGAGHLWYRRR